jgi:hypothetical protein
MSKMKILFLSICSIIAVFFIIDEVRSTPNYRENSVIQPGFEHKVDSITINYYDVGKSTILVLGADDQRRKAWIEADDGNTTDLYLFPLASGTTWQKTHPNSYIKLEPGDIYIENLWYREWWTVNEGLINTTSGTLLSIEWKNIIQ